MDMPEKNCSDLTVKTAEVIDNASLYQLFVSTQQNNLDLCVKSALKSEPYLSSNLDSDNFQAHLG